MRGCVAKGVVGWIVGATGMIVLGVCVCALSVVVGLRCFRYDICGLHFGTHSIFVLLEVFGLRARTIVFGMCACVVEVSGTSICGLC